MIVKDDSPIQSSEIVPEGQPNLEDQLEDGEVSTAYENDPGDDFYIHFNKTGVHLSHVENKIDSICSLMRITFSSYLRSENLVKSYSLVRKKHERER
jgi:hypothetical protein